LCHTVLKQSAMAEQKLLTRGADTSHQETKEAVPLLPSTTQEEADNIDFPMNDTTNHLDDYEDIGFLNPEFEEMDYHGYTTTYTKEQKFEICLLKLCTEMEAPLYAFEEIMKWARKAVVEGYDFLPIQKTYRTQIDKLEKWMCMENHRPEEISVNLPGFKNTIDTIKVTRFDFMTQVNSLLNDPVLNRDENLVINEIDRFQKYYPPNGRLGECLSGSWYNHAWDEMEKDGICDFMIPIILYIDKTQISVSGKLSIYPVQMSLGIFTEKASHYLSTPLFTRFTLTIFLIGCYRVADQLTHGVPWAILLMKQCFSLVLNASNIPLMERVNACIEFWNVYWNPFEQLSFLVLCLVLTFDLEDRRK
jgi:Plavaka transposase